MPADLLDNPLAHTDASGQMMSRQTLCMRYRHVRDNSEVLAAPLSSEDWMLQSMEEASPIKWHLAHTSWFYEAFVLIPHCHGYQCFHPDFNYLFNSYYQQIGEMHRRARRGLLSRPSAQEVIDYRAHVDTAMQALFDQADDTLLMRIAPLIELGCAHEEQHQELMQTDLLHGLSQNMLLPAAYSYDGPDANELNEDHPYEWIAIEGGLVEKGALANDGFCFDNETPRHKFYLNPFELTARPVSNRAFLEFIEDGGYQDSQYWLSDGWAEVQKQQWGAPLYWRKGDDDRWHQYTLFGEMPLILDAPVRHVSYYEAAAFASWAGVWLPTETEWEVAAAGVPVEGHFLENGKPAPHMPKSHTDSPLKDMFGSVWEWTQSPYAAYPGYRPVAGAIGEYNGKFMSSQMVLRGGSSATPAGHVRASYRNFFPPNARWQFSGFRLAR